MTLVGRASEDGSTPVAVAVVVVAVRQISGAKYAPAHL